MLSNSRYAPSIQLGQFLRIGFTLAVLTITTQPFLPSLSAEPDSARGPILGALDQASDMDRWQINDDTGSENWQGKDFPAKITAKSRPPSSPASTSPGLKVTDDGKFLVRNDGTPFFWLADSAQLLLYRLSREDVDLYLQHRANLGFTVIKTQIVSFLGINATNFYGNAPFIESDPSRPNEAFWQHVDYVIDKIESLGLVAALVPDRNLIVVDHNTNEFGPLDVSSAYAYGQYVGRRYREKPLVWVLGWDVAPAGREAVFQAEADGIAQGAAGGDHSKVLITFHPHSSTSSSDWFHNHPWLDFNSIQSGHTIDNEAYDFPETHSLIASDYAKVPSKPVLEGEPAYEDTQDGFWYTKSGRRMGSDVSRRKAYWAIFAGAFGYTYGHNDIVAFHEPGRPSYSGQRNYWKDVLDAPGAADMRHLRTLLESRPHFVHIPDQSVLVSAAGSGPDHVRATRASDNSYLLVYIPNGRPVTVNMKTMRENVVGASWFNPRTGAFSLIGQFCNAGIQSFDPPGDTRTGNDWVLVLDGVSATTAATSPTRCQSPITDESSNNLNQRLTD